MCAFFSAFLSINLILASIFNNMIVFIGWFSNPIDVSNYDSILSFSESISLKSTHEHVYTLHTRTRNNTHCMHANTHTNAYAYSQTHHTQIAIKSDFGLDDTNPLDVIAFVKASPLGMQSNWNLLKSVKFYDYDYGCYSECWNMMVVGVDEKLNKLGRIEC